MMRLAFASLLLLTSSLLASDGYVYNAATGYYNYGAGVDNYVRTWTPGYYSYGYYYPGYYSYTLVPAPKVSVATPGWRAKILDIAATRERLARESKDFNDAIKALGLSNYAAPGNGSYNSLQLSTAGAQGQTTYGYSYNSISNLYGDASLGVLYQQANRLAENAQKMAGDAAADFSQLAAQEGANRARVAEILARGQAIKAIANSLDGNKTTIKESAVSWKTTAAGTQVTPSASPWEASASKCLACHSAANKKGGLDITQFRVLPKSRQLQVIGRLVLPVTDPHHMPKDGPMLSTEEIGLWLKEVQ